MCTALPVERKPNVACMLLLMHSALHLREGCVQAVLSEQVLEHLDFKQVSGHQVAWLQGKLAEDMQARLARCEA